MAEQCSTSTAFVHESRRSHQMEVAGLADHTEQLVKEVSRSKKDLKALHICYTKTKCELEESQSKVKKLSRKLDRSRELSAQRKTVAEAVVSSGNHFFTYMTIARATAQQLTCHLGDHLLSLRPVHCINFAHPDITKRCQAVFCKECLVSQSEYTNKSLKKAVECPECKTEQVIKTKSYMRTTLTLYDTVDKVLRTQVKNFKAAMESLPEEHQSYLRNDVEMEDSEDEEDMDSEGESVATNTNSSGDSETTAISGSSSSESENESDDEDSSSDDDE